LLNEAFILFDIAFLEFCDGSVGIVGKLKHEEADVSVGP
jgi:hypothetical protein